MVNTERGQAITTEALLASFIILTGLTIAYGIIVIPQSPGNTTNTTSPSTLTTQSLLESANDVGAIEQTVLYWNTSNNTYYGANSGTYYTEQYPETPFGNLLKKFSNSTTKHANIRLIYWVDTDGDGILEQEIARFIHVADTPPEATVSEWTILLHDSDKIRSKNGEPSTTSLSDASSFPIPDISGTNIYNTVTVQVVSW